MSPSDDRKLVKVVECHHVLWDNRMKEFRDKMLTQHGWKSVAELLDREVDDVMSRWANLRKQYSRRITKLRQKTGIETPEKPWHLMPLLAFLRPCITPRKRKRSSIQNNSSSSTEEIYSSARSDDSRESSPLVVRINPVEPPRNSLLYGVPEKRLVTQSRGVQRKPFRKLIQKAKTASVCNLLSEQETVSGLSCNQEDDSLPISFPNVQNLEPNVHKMSSTPKYKYGGIKPPQKAIRSLPLKAKKLKTSSENILPSFAKSTNAPSETEKKPKLLAEKNLSSVAKSTNMSSDMENKSKSSVGNAMSSVAKSTNVSLETEKKSEIFDENVLSRTKTPKVSSEVLGFKEYDSDEHFLLSLAADFRKMDPRNKYECKIKMISMVCEQYIKN